MRRSTRRRCFLYLLKTVPVVVIIVWMATLFNTDTDTHVTPREEEYPTTPHRRTHQIKHLFKPTKKTPHREILVKIDPKSLTKTNLWSPTFLQSVKVIGKARERKRPGFLTIGVPSVKRELHRNKGESYLMTTLSSLILQSTDREKEDLSVLIFLADFDTDHNRAMADKIQRNFQEYLDSGFLRIIQIPQSEYPNLSSWDEEEVVAGHSGANDSVQIKMEKKLDRWNVKSNIDLFFMLYFVWLNGMSRYYLHLADDVTCKPRYLLHVRKFVQEKIHRQWAMLDFHHMGFMGKLLPLSQTYKLANFILLYYKKRQSYPKLIVNFKQSAAQFKPFVYKESIFKHIGNISSLDGYNPYDPYNVFETEGNFANPPAFLKTNMHSADNHTVEDAYEYDKSTFFWAKSIAPGNFILIHFRQSLRIKRIILHTGHFDHPADVISLGVIEISPTADEQQNKPTDSIGCHESRSGCPGTRPPCAESRSGCPETGSPCPESGSPCPEAGTNCTTFKTIGTCSTPLCEIPVIQSYNISCVRIRLQSGQNNWLIVHQIKIIPYENYQ